MAQISKITYSKINLWDRIDAEYFQPAYLTIENNIKKHNFEVLWNLCKIDASAFYPAATELYSIWEIPFARCVDCVNFPFVDNTRFGEFEKIPKYFLDGNINSIKTLKENEIIITKVWTPCFASIISDYEIMALSRTVLWLSNITINPYYLMIFLRSYYWFSQLQRERELTIQYQLTLDRVWRVLIPLFPTDFQYKIEKIAKESHKKEIISKQLYQEAENLLLTELGLKDHSFSHAITFSTTKKEVDQAGRYDAEYFQPKYDEMIEKIEQYQGGWDFVENIFEYKKWFEPWTEAYVEEWKKFVRVSDFSKFWLEWTDKKISEEMFDELKDNYAPKKWEILFTKDWTIGISYLLKEDLEGILSWAFLRIQVKEAYQAYDKECLTLILNSIICSLQVERFSGWALIAHLKPSDFQKLKLPLIDPQIQQLISAKVQESFKLRNESKQLLEQAKKIVEDEIEKE